jgi:hypothetical protein
MLKKFVGAAIVLVLVSGIALADTVRGFISKVSDKEVTITPYDFKKKEKGEEKTYKVSKGVKVFKAKGKDDKDKSSIDNLQKAIENSKKKAVFGSIEVEKEKVTEITYFSFGKKGKKKDD